MRFIGLSLLAGSLLSPAGAAAADSDWPSYNRTLTSERFVPLNEIRRDNVTKLKLACVFDTGETTAFQSGIVVRDGALYVTTEHDTISIDPETCNQRWRAHEDFPNSFLGAQRGVAIENGRVFRGAADGTVYAYDQKTGAKLWATSIADRSKGETVPAAPIAWHGRVFIGNAGGDNKGVKGRMYALDGATGRILWEFYLVPKVKGDRERGPQAPGVPTAMAESWKTVAGSEITGGGTWTTYSLDPATGRLYVPGGNPAPDFVPDMRKGENLFSGSVVVLDAATGAYRTHYTLAPNDFHDWDASSAPAIFTSRSGRRVLAVAPKDGHLYGYDLATSKRLYRVPLTTLLAVDVPLGPKPVRFCPGSQGGAEWNGAAYDPQHDAVITGQVDWCSTVTLDDQAKVLSVSAAQPWTGSSADGFGKQDDPSRWAGWIVSTDALSGSRRWTFRTPAPVLAGVTPTSGGVVFMGDMAGTAYALDSATGRRLWSADLGGAIAGGVVAFDVGRGERVAFATGLTSKIWPTVKTTAKVQVFKLDEALGPRR